VGGWGEVGGIGLIGRLYHQVLSHWKCCPHFQPSNPPALPKPQPPTPTPPLNPLKRTGHRPRESPLPEPDQGGLPLRQARRRPLRPAALQVSLAGALGAYWQYGAWRIGSLVYGLSGAVHLLLVPITNTTNHTKSIKPQQGYHPLVHR